MIVMLLLNCKQHGFCIDLAANDPIKISNTRALERDFDRRGVCVEPNFKYHRAISDQRRCTLVTNTSSRAAVAKSLSLLRKPRKYRVSTAKRSATLCTT